MTSLATSDPKTPMSQGSTPDAQTSTAPMSVNPETEAFMAWLSLPMALLSPNAFFSSGTLMAARLMQTPH